MRINKISFKNKVEDWELTELSFYNLTLLVGVSGAGKTQILRAILDIKKIAEGRAINGVSWNIDFSENNLNYKWTGEFEINENSLAFPHDLFLSDDEDEKITPKVKSEFIYLNDDLIAKKIDNEIYFENNKMPKLSSEESLLSLFKEEDKLKPAFEGFQKIVFRDHTSKDRGFSIRRTDFKSKDKYTTLEEIRKSNLETVDKLFFLQKNQKKVFDKIVNNYKDVFPQIEAVKIEALNSKGAHSWISDIPIVQFK
jgi:ABC-type dipeptide/oligopeptide/nickel transport system ATPase component